MSTDSGTETGLVVLTVDDDGQVLDRAVRTGAALYLDGREIDGVSVVKIVVPYDEDAQVPGERVVGGSFDFRSEQENGDRVDCRSCGNALDDDTDTIVNDDAGYALHGRCRAADLFTAGPLAAGLGAEQVERALRTLAGLYAGGADDLSRVQHDAAAQVSRLVHTDDE